MKKKNIEGIGLSKNVIMKKCLELHNQPSHKFSPKNICFYCFFKMNLIISYMCVGVKWDTLYIFIMYLYF